MPPHRRRFRGMVAQFVGARLRTIRESKGFTMGALAKASGVDVATICRIEQGRMVGTVASHLQLAVTLGVRLAELYDGIEEVWVNPW